MDFLYHIHIMTLFPDVVGDMLCESILGRAQERDIIRIDCHQIRDYTLNKQKQVDDTPMARARGSDAGRSPVPVLAASVRPEGNGSIPSTSPLPARISPGRCQAASSGLQ